MPTRELGLDVNRAHAAGLPGARVDFSSEGGVVGAFSSDPLESLKNPLWEGLVSDFLLLVTNL